jgi:hypothetical protein
MTALNLYHVDRGGRLKEGQQLCLFDDYSVIDYDCKLIHQQYPEGITEHGDRYIFDPTESSHIESVFELVRQMRYPERLSRFQAVFAIDRNGIKPFLSQVGMTPTTQIFKVHSDTVNKLDMSLLSGNTYFSLQYFANLYWSGQKSLNPLFEYLLKPPVMIQKMVYLSGQSLDEALKRIGEEEDNEAPI